MRIFESYEWNFKQIKFKENKVFFDALLEKLGIKYTNISFLFSSGVTGELCDKIIKHFPELAEYKQLTPSSVIFPGSFPEYKFTSFRTDGDEVFLHINDKHTDSFSRFLLKIPHLVNFTFMTVVLDNVEWYSEYTCCEYTSTEKREIAANANFKLSSYYSNSIRFLKEYDYGNKCNLVEIMIERIPDGDVLRPCPEIWNEFYSVLGKHRHKHFILSFDASEKECLSQAAKIIEKKIEEFKALLHVKTPSFGLVSASEGAIANCIIPISGFSPKASFSKVAKKYGYKYASYSNGRYLFRKTNENNHSFIAEIMNIPLSPFFEASCLVEGYNFKHYIFNLGRENIRSERSAEIYANRFFQAMAEAEREFTDMICTLYAKTPSWYLDF